MILKGSLIAFLILSNSFSCYDKSNQLMEVIVDDFHLENISSNTLKWSDYGYSNYQELNHHNHITDKKGKLDLDEFFNKDQQVEINDLLKSPLKFKIKKKCFENKIHLVTESPDRSKLGKVDSFSSPIILRGKGGREFGIVLLSESFIGEGTVKYLFFENKNEKWILLWQQLIRFS